MKTLKYSITIKQARKIVFEKLSNKSVYPDWAKAWGDGMHYIGEWKENTHISFMDSSQGGTKVLVEIITPNEYIKVKHIAMVNAKNEELEAKDDMMRKWLGSMEEYFFKQDGEKQTTLEIVMTCDEAFQSMFDNAWPKALAYFKEVCEK